MNEKIIRYLNETYRPESVLVYGSYADGSCNQDSDFDCLLIAANPARRHDTSEICGVRLDAFIYAPEEMQGDIDCGEFVQIYDGVIVLDRNGAAERLQKKVREYLDALPLREDQEIADDIRWCAKMLLRTARGDAEGDFRWHWLLSDSLQIYCDIRKVRYFGPKKALRQMERDDPEAFALYRDALRQFERGRLNAWIGHLQKLWRERILAGQEKDILRRNWKRIRQRKQVFAERKYDNRRYALSLIRLDRVEPPLYVGQPPRLMAADGFLWLHVLPEGGNWCLTVMRDEKRRILQYYFDITLRNTICGGESRFTDLYLDVVVTPGEGLSLLDQDELDDALDQGVITKEEHALAERTAQRLLKEIPQNYARLEAFCSNMFDELEKQL